MPAPIPKKTCTRTHKIAIQRLKGIRQLDELSLEEKPLTGIFGPNGNGKSTILHALAAAYQPPASIEGLHYWSFFPRLDQDLWNGTRFVITHSGTFDTGVAFTQAEEPYRKGTATTRWKPLETRRPIREVVYIGLKSCLPALERYSWHDLSGANSTPITDRPEQRALAAVGKILNGTYNSAARLTLTNYPTRSYLSFDKTGCGTYPSVTMGAGEQRLFEMLSIIEKTRKHALILIDEIDVLLHGDALKKLIQHLHDHCAEASKQKQIVFTSHREELLGLEEWINVRHLHREEIQNTVRHRSFASTDPDSLHRLTGKQVRKLEVFVEDKIASAIVRHVAGELGINRHVDVIPFGAATNCFTIFAGLLLKGEKCLNSLFILDGDEYLAPQDRATQINRACSGNDAKATAHRAEMTNRIKDFALPAGQNPEAYLHQLLCAVPAASLTAPEIEIQTIARGIGQPADQHGYIYHLLERLGGDHVAQLPAIIQLAAKGADWAAFTQPVREWLDARKTALNLT